MIGSPSVTSKPSAGMARLREKALAVIFWQPVQWQAMDSSGGALTLIRTFSHRHSPAQGKSGLLTSRLLG